jgi:signal transduction histidine kinase
MPAMGAFRAKAMAGGALVTLVLAAGMWFSIHRFGAFASAQTEHIRAEEQGITLAERLRWSGEVIVSAGHGYFISSDPALLARLRLARSEFDAGLLALRAAAHTQQARSLVIPVERDARNFVRVQEELALARERMDGSGGRPQDAARLVARVERELVPLQRALGRSLDHLVEVKEAALAGHYERARQERDRLAIWLYSLLAGLVLAGSIITVHFAKQIDGAYRNERDALEVARKAVAARDELMGIIAHDLRNPLLAIGLKAAVLQRSAGSDQVREQARSIGTVAYGMQFLINSMLDVASMEAGRFSVAPTRCELEDVLRESAEMLGELAAERGIRLVQIVEHPGLSIRADRARLLQVMSNLIGNALKFGPKGSEVTVTVQRQQNFACLTVRDVGAGILAEDLPCIFDRF